MSKKNKKFKKVKHQGVPQANIVDKTNESYDEVASLENEPETSIQEAPGDRREKIDENDPYKTKKYDYVKKDITKILITFAIIVLALIAAYYISTKTTFFVKISDWIYNIANIQAQ